jgi:hypothetical protein
LETHNLSYTYFLLAKYIGLAECDFLAHNQTYYLTIKDKHRIVSLIDDIIEIMRRDLNIYEYQLQETNKFKMTITDTYPLNGGVINNRTTPFVLFEQKKENPLEKFTLTHVFKADKQLVAVSDIATDRGGGKKRRTKRKKTKRNLSRRKRNLSTRKRT